MAPQQRKRSAAAQRNLERMGYSLQQDGEDDPRRESESVTVRRVKLALTFLRQAILSLRTPGNSFHSDISHVHHRIPSNCSISNLYPFASPFPVCTERFWLLLFLPSFLRYLLLMRTSLRPRPLVVGEVVDFGSLEPLVAPYAQLEV